MKVQLHFPIPKTCLLVLLAGSLQAFSTSSLAAAQVKPAIDPKADELLKHMSDYLAQARFFSVNAEIWQDLDLSSGQRVQAARTIQFQVRRPDRMHVHVQSTRRNHDVFYDAGHITLLNRAQNFYGSIHTSSELDAAMDTASERFGIAMPLEDLLRSDPRTDLLEKVNSGTYIGPVDVMGVPCEHLAFSQDNIDWQLWIETGARPVPKKFLITYKDEAGSPQFTAVFSNWDFVTTLPDFVFKFEPPPGASQIPIKEIRVQNQASNSRSK